jgi:hypothetical protein
VFASEVIAAIKQHALEAFPEEACGVVLAEGYRPLDNTAAEPLRDFRIAPKVYAGLEARILAVVHSHPCDDPEGGRRLKRGFWPDCPTAADMRQQIATAKPWGITVTDGQAATEPFWFGDQAPRPPLIGRAFRHGVDDCYSLIRDWYAETRGIRLPEFPRDDDWWNAGGDLYRDGFESAGFARVGAEEVRAGDVFLAQVRSSVPNHGGVYLGRGLGLHHLPGRLSRREPILRWQRFVTHWLRYLGDET